MALYQPTLEEIIWCEETRDHCREVGSKTGLPERLAQFAAFANRVMHNQHTTVGEGITEEAVKAFDLHPKNQEPYIWRSSILEDLWGVVDTLATMHGNASASQSTFYELARINRARNTRILAELDQPNYDPEAVHVAVTGFLSIKDYDRVTVTEHPNREDALLVDIRTRHSNSLQDYWDYAIDFVNGEIKAVNGKPKSRTNPNVPYESAEHIYRLNLPQRTRSTGLLNPDWCYSYELRVPNSGHAYLKPENWYLGQVRAFMPRHPIAAPEDYAAWKPTLRCFSTEPDAALPVKPIHAHGLADDAYFNSIWQSGTMNSVICSYPSPLFAYPHEIHSPTFSLDPETIQAMHRHIRAFINYGNRVSLEHNQYRPLLWALRNGGVGIIDRNGHAALSELKSRDTLTVRGGWGYRIDAA